MHAVHLPCCTARLSQQTSTEAALSTPSNPLGFQLSFFPGRILTFQYPHRPPSPLPLPAFLSALPPLSRPIDTLPDPHPLHLHLIGQPLITNRRPINFVYLIPLICTLTDRFPTCFWYLGICLQALHAPSCLRKTKELCKCSR
jgi:hypothetical protein